MFEYFIYIALPVLITLFYLQKRFFHSWRFLLISTLAIYLGLWTSPFIYELIKAVFPRELAVYSKLCTLSVLIIIFFLIFYQISAMISSHSGGGYHLPRGRSFRNLPVCGLIGLLYSGLIGYLICISPLHCKLATSDSFAEKAVRRMQVFTVIIDRLSLQSATMAQRKQGLEKRIYPRIDPREVAAKKAAEIRAAKEAAIKQAAEEKAAAEKAAAEKARLDALERERNRGRITDASGVWKSKEDTPKTAPVQPVLPPVQSSAEKGHGRGRIVDSSGVWTPHNSVPEVQEQNNTSKAEPFSDNGSMTNNNAPFSSGETPGKTAAGKQGEYTAL